MTGPDLVVLETVLDELGIGTGPVSLEPIGEGHSNLTFLLRRTGVEAILRTPPEPPYEPTAHDVIREARVLSALRDTAVPVPEVLLAVTEPDGLGVPFYLMERVHGDIINAVAPQHLRSKAERRRTGFAFIEALAAVHLVDYEGAGLEGIGSGEGFLRRQLRRFGRIREASGGRDLDGLDAIGEWLEAQLPEQAIVTLVHGDFRLGNIVWAPQAPATVAAVLDWELATVGDPFVDVGYFLATYPEAGDRKGPILSLAGAIADGGYPSRSELLAHYLEVTGFPSTDLAWYETYAYWRAAVGLESFYKRMLDGTMVGDRWIEELEFGVPQLVERARGVVETERT